MTDLISRDEVVGKLKKAYFDKNLQEAKNDPCVIDSMTDWAIRQVKNTPSYYPWHTGEPTRTDCLYLVLWYDTEDEVRRYSVLHWHDQLHCWYDEETPYCLWGDEDRAEVVAWMPFKPYRRMKNE